MAVKYEKERKKRTKDPGVRVVGRRIYDSQNGKTCHQCRQKTLDFAASCKFLKRDKECPIQYCHKCLLNRYGEKAEEVAQLEDWTCPKCRGICNCSFCMKKRGQQPTGILANTAKATGFSSVSELLKVKGSDNLPHCTGVKDIDASLEKLSSSKEESEVVSPRKLGNGNTLDRQHDSNKKKPAPLANEKSNKRKREGFSEQLKVSSSESLSHHTGNKSVDASSEKPPCQKEESKVDSPRKLRKVNTLDGQRDSNKRRKASLANEKKSNRGKQGHIEIGNGNKQNNIGVGITPEKDKVKKRKMETAEFGVAEKPDSESLRALNGPEDMKVKAQAKRVKEAPKLEERGAYILCQEEIKLPQGMNSITVAGVELPPEDVGNVLQFLEFCSAFSEALELRKGVAHSVIRELINGRSTRKLQYSATFQIHSQLLSVILKDRGEKSPLLSPAGGKDCWLKALGECVSESEFELKEIPSEYLENGVDAYEKLDSSKKLKLLNFLCDEALCTVALRSWIEKQSVESAERKKEAKTKVAAAREKEKQLKHKLQNEVARGVLAKNAYLSVAEYEAVVSQIKAKAAEAHAELMKVECSLSERMQRSDAVRTDPILLDYKGRVFWRLKSYTGKPNILLQYMGTEIGVSPDEKWFCFKPERKEELEKCITYLRGIKATSLKTLRHTF